MYLNLINLVTLHEDCPSQGLTILKHKVFSPISWSHQFYLDSRTDFTSTWLCAEIFRSWIRNSGSPAPKYSELLASHRGDRRLEGHLYPYPFEVTLDSKVLWSWSHSVKYTPTFTCIPYQHLHAPWLRGQPTYMAYNDLHLICLSS